MTNISPTETSASQSGGQGGMSLFDLLGTRMDYLKQRQSVIAQNVANADAPGYKASDLAPFADTLKGIGVKPVQVATTDAAHIQPTGRKVGGDYSSAGHTHTYETLPSGNSVVLEEQMMKIAQVNTDYSMVTGIYKQANAMMKMALGKSS